MRLQVVSDIRLLGKTFFLLLVLQSSWRTVAGQSSRNYSPGMYYGGGYGSGARGLYGGYGRYGAKPYGPQTYSPLPYGGLVPPLPPPLANLPPSVAHFPPPPPAPTSVVVTQGYSTSTTVPAIKSTAALSNYATVAAFNTTESARFVTTLEANILKLLDVLANVTIDSVTQGSVNVDDTISFTGADSASATSARDALFTALTSGDTSIFGTSFGSVKVSGVSSTNSSNPAHKSGAGAMGWTTVTTLVVAAVCVLTATVYVSM